MSSPAGELSTDEFLGRIKDEIRAMFPISLFPLFFSFSSERDPRHRLSRARNLRARESRVRESRRAVLVLVAENNGNSLFRVTSLSLVRTEAREPKRASERADGRFDSVMRDGSRSHESDAAESAGC